MSKSAVIAEMVSDVEEFLDSSEGLDDLLSELRALGEGEAPPPSGELLALLAGSSAVHPLLASRRATRRASRRNAMAGLAAATVAGLSITGAAAAANELPTPMQRAVAHFSESYLPFSFPRPVGDSPTAGAAASSAAADPDGSAAGWPGATGQDGRPAGRHRTDQHKDSGRARAATTEGGIPSASPQGTATSLASGGSRAGEPKGQTTGQTTGQNNGQNNGQTGGQGDGQNSGQNNGQNNGQTDGQGSQGSAHKASPGAGSDNASSTGSTAGKHYAYAGQGNAGTRVRPTAPPGQVRKSSSSGGSASTSADDSKGDPAADATTTSTGGGQASGKGNGKDKGQDGKGGRSTP